MSTVWVGRVPVLEIVSDGERLAPVVLREGVTTLGRHPDCVVVLPDPHSSRRHVKLDWSEADLRFEDLGSKNPLEVNGAPQGSGLLFEGDELRFGETSVTITSRTTGGRPDGGEESVRWVTGKLGDASRQRSIDARDSVSIGGEADLPERARLDSIYRLAERFVCSGDDAVFFQNISEPLFSALPAARGLIALGDPKRDECDVVHVWRIDAAPDEPIAMSQTILDEIQLEQKSLLVEDVPADFGRDAEQSISDLGIRSFMCAPILDGEAMAGFLYVDQRQTEEEEVPRAFDDEDLRYLNGVAHLLALALDERALRERRERENLQFREILRRKSEIIGSSKPMVEIVDQLERVAEGDLSVLVRGETGTGKELIARAIHDRSERRAGPFVAFNCALSSPSLIESELFGHVKGAFTDAARDHRGKFQLADGGTLFLDEIGDMPLETQVKLLRVLQEREVSPVGSESSVPIDIRLITATHRDLEKGIKSQEFRADLFYRVAVITLEVPALRDRGADILELARAFLPEGTELESAAEKAMLAYGWPGNVRELQNVIEQACFNATGTRIKLQDLPASIAKEGRRHRVEVPLATLSELEAKHIRKVLRATENNKKRAAEILGISRETLYQKIRLYGLDA